MSENITWTAVTKNDWIFFDASHTATEITGAAGDNITIYVIEATNPNDEEEGSITITSSDGTAVTKSVIRCLPTVTTTDKSLSFKLNPSGKLGPCNNGASNKNGNGVEITDILLKTKEHYSTGGEGPEITTQLSLNDVNVKYVFEDGTYSNLLSSNDGKDRNVKVVVSLKNDDSASGYVTTTQSGIYDDDNNIIPDMIDPATSAYSSNPVVKYENFKISEENCSSPTCSGNTMTFHVDGEKLTKYGSITALTVCGYNVSYGDGETIHSDIPIDDIEFTVENTHYAYFQGNVLTYSSNNTANDIILQIKAESKTQQAIATTTFTIKKGDECISKIYIIAKAYKGDVEQESPLVDYTGGTIEFRYYLAYSETAREENAIKENSIYTSLNFRPPTGVSVENTTMPKTGVFSTKVNFIANNNSGGINWPFNFNCEIAVVKSKEIKVYQSSANENIIPNCDYFIFKYKWEQDAGVDLDTLTCISNCPSLSGLTLGWNGTANNEIEKYRIKSITTNDGKPLIKWGGDNQCNGYEYTILCVKNIINAYKDNEIDFVFDDANKQEMHIDIYANWFTSKGINPKMCINYDQYSGNTISGDYYDEIKETEHTNTCLTVSNQTIYYSFSPKSENSCKIISEGKKYCDIDVNAGGRTNADIARQIECIDIAYTHVARFSYNFLADKTFFDTSFTDNGIDMFRLGYYISENGTVDSLPLTKYYDSSPHEVAYEDVFLKLQTGIGEYTDCYIFDNDDDYIVLNEYYYDSGPKQISQEKYKKTDLGTKKNLEFVKNFVINKSNDGSVNINFELQANDDGINDWDGVERSLDLTFYCNIKFNSSLCLIKLNFGSLITKQRNTQG